MEEKDIKEEEPVAKPQVQGEEEEEEKKGDVKAAQQNQEMPAMPAELFSKQNMEKFQKILGGGADPKSAKFRQQIERIQRMIKKHQFWDTQPVPKLSDEEVKQSAPIDSKTTVADVKKAPYALPEGFEWSDVNLKDDDEAKDVYNLLTKNYVEDDDGDFRFDYSIEFLRWTLLVPTYKPKWHIGVRVSKSKKLVGFISGIPLTIMVDGNQVKSAEINFLCVLNKLRTKRLAPVLIKEVTRRINLKGIFQAIYTAGVHLPRPISQTKYFHRSLNPPKLVDVGFSSLPMNTKVSQLVKKYKLPKELRNKGLRPMTKKDTPKVHKLLMTYFEEKKFRVYTKFTLQEVAHLLLPRENVIQTYVLDDANDPKKVTDLISFYHLPSSILKSEKHQTLYVAYSFYNVATSAELSSLIKDALIMCKQRNFDVYNSLNIMENATVFDELKFGQGNGNLQYYLYNWKMPTAEPSDLGIVLV